MSTSRFAMGAEWGPWLDDGRNSLKWLISKSAFDKNGHGTVCNLAFPTGGSLLWASAVFTAKTLFHEILAAIMTADETGACVSALTWHSNSVSAPSHSGQLIGRWNPGEMVVPVRGTVWFYIAGYGDLPGAGKYWDTSCAEAQAVIITDAMDVIPNAISPLMPQERKGLPVAYEDAPLLLHSREQKPPKPWYRQIF